MAEHLAAVFLQKSFDILVGKRDVAVNRLRTDIDQLINQDGELRKRIDAGELYVQRQLDGE